MISIRTYCPTKPILTLALMIGFGVCMSQEMTPEVTSDCDRDIYAAREMYNRGQLHEMLDLLIPCLDDQTLATRQRRQLYRLLAESYVFTQDYPQASEYARRLAEIDPQLRVYGVSPRHAKDQDLREVIRTAQEADAPDLLLLVGNIRYNALGFELFGGPVTEAHVVRTERIIQGATDVSGQMWSDVRGASVGLGVTYDPYRFPLGMAARLRFAGQRYRYSEELVFSSGAVGRYSGVERQQWLSPEFWLRYQFAPKTFPVKELDISLRMGAGADILVTDYLEGALFDHPADADWYGGQEFNIKPLISQSVYFSLLAGLGADYRFGRNCLFAELQYRHPFLASYQYQAGPYRTSDDVGVHQIGVLIGFRYVLYKPFYK